MRIVIATTSGFHLRHLAREFVAAGQDATYLSYLPAFRIRRDGIPLTKAPSFFWRLAPWSFFALNRRWRSLQQRAVLAMLKRADAAYAEALPPCDMFIGLSAMADKCARVARAKYGAKIIIERGSTHVLTQNELVGAGGEALPGEYVARELTSYDVADFVALPSAHAVESFVEQGFAREKLFKNAYGVDLGRFHPTPVLPGPMRLLYVGQWSRRKGCDVLAEALRRSTDLNLTHVGMPSDLELPRLSNFRSLGHKTHAELSALMGAHHMLVLPSREDGFGMVLIEALASGLPVVASSRTGGPDLADLIADKDAVAIIPPGDPQALLDAVSGMAGYVARQDPGRKILTETDRQNLSWTAYARRYSDFLAAIA